ncbi:MAG: S8 family serine peptidase [Eubacteriales bacterium]|nr:S8 family serine peptidase [Eubacteriales bacterium]
MRKFFAVMLVVLLTMTAVAYATSPAKVEKVSVIIGLANENGRASVLAAGGKIQREFKFINAVQVELPKVAVEKLKTARGVEFVEPDFLAQACAQTVPWGIEHVNAPDVHSAGFQGSGIKVAVLDTGILTSHADLQVVGGYDTTGIGSYVDDNGHGTHVAGTVAALNNTIGVIGAAPAAQLYAVKVLDRNGSGTYSNIIAGIEWTINNDIDVINMSLGGSSGSIALEQACDAAYQAGILVVAAAGNEGTSTGGTECIGYPAKYSSVMAVGSITSSNIRSYFSSTGSTLEIMAPGSDIYSTTINGSYGTMSGTSMACPHVAGVAALVWSAKPSLTNVQLRSALNETANDLWNDPWRYGNGLVDAWAAYQFVTNGTIPDPEPGALNAAIATDKEAYTLKQTIYITVTATDENNAPVADANVSLEVVSASGRKSTLTGITGSDGKVSLSYKTKVPDGKGTYTLTAAVTKGTLAATAAKTVTVN